LVRGVLQEIKYREQLQEAYKELQKLDEAKSEFVSIASHQLRTPLTAIKGYISLLLEGSYGELTEKNKPPIENIYESSERLIKLINDLLNFSRIESGKMEMNFKQGSLEEVIAQVMEELKYQAEKKGLYLKREKTKTSPPEFLIDKEKIKQAFMNVLDNAIKYTTKGGVVIKTKVRNSKALIEVSDTGEGMTKEEIIRSFKSFTRGSAGNKLAVDGAGLGLYIARRFIEIHGGKIWAESLGKGKGSTIFIELPIKTEKGQVGG
jgi:signal transduction histidine kinase